jgi:hypothetical protein
MRTYQFFLRWSVCDPHAFNVRGSAKNIIRYSPRSHATLKSFEMLNYNALLCVIFQTLLQLRCALNVARHTVKAHFATIYTTTYEAVRYMRYIS